MIRSTLSVASVAATIRRVVREMDKDLPVTDVVKMPDTIGASIAQPRFRTFLLGLFAAMRWSRGDRSLRCDFLFGVGRTSEIGIRMRSARRTARSCGWSCVKV